jgi:phage FluMu protein Com
MDYKFGISKVKFKGTKEEWDILRNTIAWQNEVLSNYSTIVVKCPHCGAINSHTIEKLDKHKACKLNLYDGIKIKYECPGYKIGIYM